MQKKSKHQSHSTVDVETNFLGGGGKTFCKFCVPDICKLDRWWTIILISIEKNFLRKVKKMIIIIFMQSLRTFLYWGTQGRAGISVPCFQNFAIRRAHNT